MCNKTTDPRKVPIADADQGVWHDGFGWTVEISAPSMSLRSGAVADARLTVSGRIYGPATVTGFTIVALASGHGGFAPGDKQYEVFFPDGLIMHLASDKERLAKAIVKAYVSQQLNRTLSQEWDTLWRNVIDQGSRARQWSEKELKDRDSIVKSVIKDANDDQRAYNLEQSKAIDTPDRPKPENDQKRVNALRLLHIIEVALPLLGMGNLFADAAGRQLLEMVVTEVRGKGGV